MNSTSTHAKVLSREKEVEEIVTPERPKPKLAKSRIFGAAIAGLKKQKDGTDLKREQPIGNTSRVPNMSSENPINLHESGRQRPSNRHDNVERNETKFKNRNSVHPTMYKHSISAPSGESLPVRGKTNPNYENKRLPSSFQNHTNEQFNQSCAQNSHRENYRPKSTTRGENFEGWETDFKRDYVPPPYQRSVSSPDDKPSPIKGNTKSSFNNQTNCGSNFVQSRSSEDDCGESGWTTESETDDSGTVELTNTCRSFEINHKVYTGHGNTALTITRNFSKGDDAEAVTPETDSMDVTDVKNFKIEMSSKHSQNGVGTSNSKLSNLINSLPETFKDPLAYFLDCDPIPPPQLPSFTSPLVAMNLDLYTQAAANKKQSAESIGYFSTNEVELEDSENDLTTFEDFDHIPDEKQFSEITYYLKRIENLKSMDLEIADKIKNDVKSVINRYVKGNTLIVYGSYLSGLAVTTSNLNLALKPEQTPNNSFLLHLQKLLSGDRTVVSFATLYDVVPFEEDPNPKKSKICFYEQESGVPCELVYFAKNASDHLQVANLLKEVCDYDPRIRTLIIASRIWAEVCAIHEPENGKLHPLGFALLIIHFLQQLEKPVLPSIDTSSKNWGLKHLANENCSSVGELWLDFLKYYSYTFNWIENVATVCCKNSISKHSKSWENSWIAIEDPCSKKNVADSVVSTECAECIFSCFKASYHYFLSPADSQKSCPSNCIEIESKNSDLKDCGYDFNDISFEQPLPSFCEECDELDGPCEKCRPSPKAVLPTLPKLEESCLKSVNTVLHEIYNEFVLADSKVHGRRAFVKNLEAYIKRICPDAKLTLFGSSVNAFGFKNSDLDICMVFKNQPKESITNMKATQIIRKITYHLRKGAHYENVIGLYGAQIPIVKFRFIPQNWNCDLSLYNILAVHNSTLLSKYALMDERCRILGCAMKLLTKKACLADCASKTLSSYSYILMVIHYLQKVEPPVLPVLPVEDKKVFEKELEVQDGILNGRNCWYYEDADELKRRYLPDQRNESTVGELWLGLLEFYLKYDYDYAVTITQKEPVLSSSLLRFARLFNIEDPFLSGRNLGCIVSDRKAEETRKIFGRARLLFGREISKDFRHDPKTYYFSASNLTGRFLKEVECLICGGFGHEKSECQKANPFKRFKPRNRVRPPTLPYKRTT